MTGLRTFDRFDGGDGDGGDLDEQPASVDDGVGVAVRHLNSPSGAQPGEVLHAVHVVVVRRPAVILDLMLPFEHHLEQDRGVAAVSRWGLAGSDDG